MILVFGKTGQVATELQRHSNAVIALGRDTADLSDPEACAAIIAETQAYAVINAAAYTAVDRAEEEEALATMINGHAPAAMARACVARGLPFVHISTDYVFDGAGQVPFDVDQCTGPLGAYGRSKLAGEEAVRAAGGVHAILRTSWVISAHGNNFVKTMLRFGSECDQLNIVADQVGGPTAASDIAEACLLMAGQLVLYPEKSGTYHFSGAPDVSWADFGREIFARSGTNCEVVDIPTTEYPTLATRPLNSRMDNAQIEAVFGIKRPNWRPSLTDILNDLGVLKT